MKSPIDLNGIITQRCDLLCNAKFNLKKANITHEYDGNGKIKFLYNSLETTSSDYQLSFKEILYTLKHFYINNVTNIPAGYSSDVPNEIKGECILFFESQNIPASYLSISMFLKPTNSTGKSQKCFTEFLSTLTTLNSNITNSSSTITTRSNWTLHDILPGKKSFYWFSGTGFLKTETNLTQNDLLEVIIFEEAIYIDEDEFAAIKIKAHESESIFTNENNFVFYNNGEHANGEKAGRLQIKCEKVKLTSDISFDKPNVTDNKDDDDEGNNNNREETTFTREMRKCDNPNALSSFEGRFAVFVTALIGLITLLFFFKGSETTEDSFLKLPLKIIGIIIWTPVHFSYVYFSKTIIAIIYILMFCIHWVYDKIKGLAGWENAGEEGVSFAGTFISMKDSLYDENYKAMYNVGIILAIIILIRYFFTVFGSPFASDKKGRRPPKDSIARNVANVVGGNYKIDDFEKETDLKKIIPKESYRTKFINDYFLKLESNHSSSDSLKIAIKQLKFDLLEEHNGFSEDIKLMVKIDPEGDPFKSFDFPNVTITPDNVQQNFGMLRFDFCKLWNDLYSSDCLNIPKKNCSVNNKSVNHHNTVRPPNFIIETAFCAEKMITLSIVAADIKRILIKPISADADWESNQYFRDNYITPSLAHNSSDTLWLHPEKDFKKGILVTLSNGEKNMVGYIYGHQNDIFFRREFDRISPEFYFVGDACIKIAEKNSQSSVIGDILMFAPKTQNMPQHLPLNSRRLLIKNYDSSSYSSKSSSGTGNFEGNQFFSEMYLKNGSRQIATLSELSQTGSERLQPPIVDIIIKAQQGEKTTLAKGQIFKTEFGDENSEVWFKFTDEFVASGTYEEFDGAYCDIGVINIVPYEINHAPFIVLQVNKFKAKKNKNDQMGQQMGYYKQDPTYFGNPWEEGGDFLKNKNVEKDPKRWNQNRSNVLLSQYYDFLPDRKLKSHAVRHEGPLVTLSTVSVKGERNVSIQGHLWQDGSRVFFTRSDNNVSYSAYFPENKIVDIKIETPLNYFRLTENATELRIHNFIRESYEQTGYPIAVKKKGSLEFTSIASEWADKNITEVDAYLTHTNKKQHILTGDGELQGPRLILKTTNNAENNNNAVSGFSNKIGKIIKHRNSITSNYLMYFVPETKVSNIWKDKNGGIDTDLTIQFIENDNRKKENSVIEQDARQTFITPLKKGTLKRLRIFLIILFSIIIAVIVIVGIMYLQKSGKLSLYSENGTEAPARTTDQKLNYLEDNLGDE
jgi:hypothetical protein